MDYYNILEVNRNANEDDLKKSYLHLVRIWHPDKNHDNMTECEAKFKQISEAYDVLSDPEKRQIYDSKEFAGSFCASGTTSNSNCNGGRELRKAKAVEYLLPCSLKDLYTGVTKSMKITRNVFDHCGELRMSFPEILTVYLKPDWKNGKKITFREKGNVEPGFISADIVFVVYEKPHPVYKRDGNDLVMRKEITLLGYLAGTTFVLTTLLGRRIKVHIPRFRHEVIVINEGMPILNGPIRKGNLRIKISVRWFPKRLTEARKHDLKRVSGERAS